MIGTPTQPGAAMPPARLETVPGLRGDAPSFLLARKLAEALEVSTCDCSGVRVAPTLYLVRDPSLSDQPGRVIEALERSLSRYLTWVAALRGYLTLGPISVTIAGGARATRRTGPAEIVCAHRPVEIRTLAVMHRTGAPAAGSRDGRTPACRLTLTLPAG